jgi:MFS family permease
LYLAIIAGIISLVSLIIYATVETWSAKRFEIEKDGQQEKIVLKDALKFGKSYWYITLLCIVFYSAMFPFQTFAVKFFEDVHHAGRDAGGFLSSILTFAAMIFTPLFGLLSDKIGKRSHLMMLGSFLIIPVYLIMGYKIGIGSWLGLPDLVSINIGFLDIHIKISSSLIIPMAMMGISFSLIPAVMWPSVALIVNKSRLGTAYGLMNMIQNIGLAGFNLIIGFANDQSHAGKNNPNGYLPGMWIFSICGFLGLLFSFLLMQNEKKPGSHGLDNRA